MFRGGDHIQALRIQRMTSFNCFSTFRWVLESELRSSGLYYLGMAKTYPLSLARSLPLNRPPIPRLPWKDSRSSSLPSVLWGIFFLCSKQFGFPLSLPVWTNFAQVLCDFHHSGFSFITALYQNDSWSLVFNSHGLHTFIHYMQFYTTPYLVLYWRLSLYYRLSALSVGYSLSPVCCPLASPHTLWWFLCLLICLRNRLM